MDKKFICNLCQKPYKSYQSLWNHNKRFHTLDKSNISRSSPPTKPNISTPSATETQKNTYKCSYCDDIFKHYQSRWKHEKKCKIRYENDKNTLKIENKKLKEQNELLKSEFKKELDEFKKDMLEIMIKNCKVHPKTLQKINNQLNNCNITNINIVQLGKEDIVNTLSKAEKLKILNKCNGSFNKLIEHVHFNPKYPQFNNIAITNLKDDYAYKYDEDENKFIACKKEELLEDLLDTRTIDLEDILNENVEEINNIKVSKLKDLISNLYDKNDWYDKNKADIKLMIYNKCDKESLKV